MKIASRPPRGGGSPHWFLGKLCGSQLIDFKLEIGGPFPRTGTWQTFGLPQEGMKIASRPPRGGGSPHWFLGKLCGSQLIDFKLEIGGPFPRNDFLGGVIEGFADLK